MTDRTASPGRAIERAKTNRRGGPAGRQAVGDYVGQPAGDAAQAVRRAGLRPGLDRMFGCAQELMGLVVAQEPTAGSELSRNGMVTLYVAAPGSEPVDGDTDSTHLGGDTPEPAKPVQGEAARAEAPSAPREPRRRKPARARRAAPTFDTPPAPALRHRASASEQPTVVLAPPAIEPPSEIDEADRERGDGEAPGEPGEEASAHDEFVVHMEDVLAGRSGPATWRGAYPRRRALRGAGDAGGVRGWLGQHRLASGAVAVAVVMWAIVAIASALEGYHSHTPTVSAVAGNERRAVTHRTRAPKPARDASSSRTVRAAPRFPVRTAQPRAASRTRRQRRPAPAPVTEAVAPRVAAAREAPVPATPAPRVSVPPAPASEQTRGGLFSP